MKITIKPRLWILGLLLCSGVVAGAQTSSNNNPVTTKTKEMKTYVIEREIPGAGKLTPEQLKGISQASCSVLKEMGTSIQWVQSYVTGNKLYCIYKAENEELIREHAKKGGFPCNLVSEVATMISPATAEQGN
ncbi:MAG: DUF4242 domain-containing protein [Chitinophagaceae bacterium]